MELDLFVYLAGVVGKLSALLLVMCLTATVVYVGYFVSFLDQSPRDIQWSMKKRYLFLIIALWFSFSTIPSEKTMYMMLAGYTAQTVVQSDTADKVLKVINQKLDGYLEETTKVKEKK